jgi:hypothetical protein
VKAYLYFVKDATLLHSANLPYVLAP